VFAPVAVFMVLHAVESNIVSPLIVGRRLSLSPVSVFLSVMFWGWLWGIPGALIAVPVLIGLRSLCRRARGLRLLRRFLEGDRREAPPSLRSLLRRPPRQPGQKRYT
jgi:predicted PurR-regulated permease PerM